MNEAEGSRGVHFKPRPRLIILSPYAEQGRRIVSSIGDSQPSTSSNYSWSFLDDVSAQSEESEDEADSIRDQLVRYLREPRISMDIDVLQFWKIHKNNYPELSALARRYLCKFK